MVPKIPSVKMSNGVDFPLFGLGTWQAKDEKELKGALSAAIDAGYRYIDTAQMYQNEHIIGEFFEEAIKEGRVKREEIFITSKLGAMYHNPEKAEETILESLKKLRTDYIDLFLIHGPWPFKNFNFQNMSESEPDLVPHIDTWRVLEKFYKLGKFRSIGISNFNKQQIQALYDQAEIKPHNLQVECHIVWPQNDLYEFCKKLGITFTSYATIGSPARISPDPSDPNPMEVPLVLELAKKYNKTPAQILLRQMVQRGISTIPKSVKPDRLRENINIFDFELTPQEMGRFNTEVKNHKRLFNMNFAKHHPWHPFGA